MQALRISLAAVLLSASALCLAQSSGGVSVIEIPGGGTIATAQMPAQHTVQGAMGKVLQYVRNRFGARPQIARVLRGADGKSLAVIFTVRPTKQSTQEVAGLALVAVSDSGPAKGAVLADQADRFRTTVRPMLDHLFSRSGATPAATAGPAGPATPAAPAASAAPVLSHASSALAGGTAPSGAAAGLHRTPFPDNSGIVALPAGWQITAAHAGEVIATGPSQAVLHFNWQLTVIDLRTPAGRRLLASIGGRLGGNFDIPYGSDAAASFKAAMIQVVQKQNKTPPSIEVVSSKLQSQQQGTSTYLVEANVGATDGVAAARTWAQVTIWPPNNYGSYLITLNLIKVPQQVSMSSATVTAMFDSYGVNNSVALSQLASDHKQSQQAVAAQLAVNRQQQAASDRQFANYQRQQDVEERQFQAFDNDLLDRTVVRDTDLNGHGTVSNDLADALIDANPNRFQEVPPSQFVKGIDY